MFRVLSFCVVVLIAAPASAQVFTLQQCIDSALVTNIQVKQTGLLYQSAGVQWNQSRLNLLPDLSADIFHGLSQGRSIDPNSNSYVNQSLNYASYGLNSSVTVFGGGALRNTVKQAATAYEASRMDVQSAKDNLVLNVMIAYLQVLNGQDLLQSTLRQAAVTGKELERLQVLDAQGAIKPSDLSDLKGQLMNDQLAISAARNAVEVAKLTLSQWMNRPYSPALDVERIAVTPLLAGYAETPETIYSSAVQQLAVVKAAGLRKKSLAYGIQAARGSLYPTISIGGGLATNYSSTAQNASGKIPYNGQLQNNMATSFGVGLSIPIFNRAQSRNRITQATILWKNSLLQEEATTVLLRQQIEQAHLNLTNAGERYKLLQSQVEAYAQSFAAAEVRYNAGVGTSYDYLLAKDRLDRANTNLIGAQYDYILRRKVLEFYKGK